MFSSKRLKEHLHWLTGNDSFRPLQEEAVVAVLSGATYVGRLLEALRDPDPWRKQHRRSSSCIRTLRSSQSSRIWLYGHGI